MVPVWLILEMRKDSSVMKVLALEAWGLEFNPQHSHSKKKKKIQDELVNSALGGRDRFENLR